MSIRSIRLYCEAPVTTTRQTVFWARVAFTINACLLVNDRLLHSAAGGEHHLALSVLSGCLVSVFAYRLAVHLFPSKDADRVEGTNHLTYTVNLDTSEAKRSISELSNMLASVPTAKRVP